MPQNTRRATGRERKIPVRDCLSTGGTLAEFIKWRDAWLFGVDQLDHQHRQMAQLLNRLVRECACSDSKKRSMSEEKKRVLAGLLDELYTLSKQHFRDEEALMMEEEYPAYVQHAREHAMLLGEFKSTFRAKLDEGCCNMNPQTLTALKSWFVVHVACSDRKFAEHLQARRAAGGGFAGGDAAARYRTRG
jgi:hemerythrin-like metal-binding protein